MKTGRILDPDAVGTATQSQGHHRLVLMCRTPNQCFLSAFDPVYDAKSELRRVIQLMLGSQAPDSRRNGHSRQGHTMRRALLCAETQRLPG